MGPRPLFADRADAGRRLAEALPRPRGEAVVLGMARGGVPVAAAVARALKAPLDVLVVRKVGHPRQPEYALGAVSEDGVVLPEGVAPEAAAEQLALARAQAERLRGGAAPVPVEGRTAIVVDDGLATGRSMATALETVARRDAAEVWAAVPVAAGPAFRDLSERLPAYAVAVVEPPEFFAVGQFYADFGQVDDERVAAVLAERG